MNIKGLVFDLDGVITETASLHYRAWAQEVKKELNIDFTEEENVKLKGMPRIDTLLAILKMHNMENQISFEKIKQMANHKNDVYKKMLETDISEHDVLPGIKKLLDDAKEKNIKLAVASSSYNAPFILKKLNLFEYFDFIVNPDNVVHGKPAPDIFLAACEGINVAPNEALGFEDAVPGIAGLADAKIKSVAITHGDNADWSRADIVLQSTNELDLNKLINKLR